MPGLCRTCPRQAHHRTGSAGARMWLALVGSDIRKEVMYRVLGRKQGASPWRWPLIDHKPRVKIWKEEENAW